MSYFLVSRRRYTRTGNAGKAENPVYVQFVIAAIEPAAHIIGPVVAG
jgi:hypothetical protein